MAGGGELQSVEVLLREALKIYKYEPLKILHFNQNIALKVSVTVDFTPLNRLILFYF